MLKKISITVEILVKAPVDQVWMYWTEPRHIMQWNNASPDWHTPSAAVDLKVGGTFLSRMEARDGSVGFDFNGTFTNIIFQQRIEYSIEGGRTVSVSFENQNGHTLIKETFEAENENPIEMQQEGWQAILNNFKKYTESH